MELVTAPTRGCLLDCGSGYKLGLIAAVFVALASGCGGNAFSSFETTNIAEKAVVQLEQNNPGEAVEILLSHLGSTFRSLVEGTDTSTDFTVLEANLVAARASLVGSIDDLDNKISILATAIADRVGVDILDLMIEVAQGQALTASSEFSQIEALFPLLPAGTEDNLIQVRLALSVLESIGAENYPETDQIKSGVFAVAAAGLAFKLLDVDGDGTISASDISQISTSSADTVIAQLSDSATAVSNGGDQLSDFATTLSTISEGISSTDGDSATQLQEFLTTQISSSEETTE